jgi:hypothetical protein
MPSSTSSERTDSHWRELGDPNDRLSRRQPVGAAGVDAGVDLVVQPRHAHHVELVEVRGVDGEKLEALEQRQRLVLSQLEHPLVELHPRELAVRVELGGIELRGGWRNGNGFHSLSLYGGASR